MRERILLIAVCLLVLTSCWDEENIEDRGFVVGVAIDLDDEQSDDEEIVFSLTNQFVVPSGFSLSEQGPGGGGSESYNNLTANGKSLMEIARKMDTKTSRPPYFEQLKVLLISEDIAKHERLLGKVMDVYIRDREMRRGIKVMITKGQARRLLQINPAQGEKLPAIYIDAVMENGLKNNYMIKPVRVGKLHQFLLDKSSFTLPYLSVSGDHINSQGVAVFHGYNNKMVGTLDGTETKGLNLVAGEAKSGMVNFKIDNEIMTFEIRKADRSIKIKPQDTDNMDISVHLNVEGNIAEMFNKRSLWDPKYLDEVEKKISESIEKLVKVAIEKGQKELNADIFGFDRILKQRHYDLWKTVHKDWERGKNLFANSNVNVSVKTSIRRVGNVDKVKD